jgi:hypothetical protein
MTARRPSIDCGFPWFMLGKRYSSVENWSITISACREMVCSVFDQDCRPREKKRRAAAILASPLKDA